MFSNPKRSGGSPRASPLKNCLLFKVSSPSQFFISLLLTPPFQISLFLPLSQWFHSKFKCDVFPPTAQGSIPGSQGQLLLSSPNIPNNSGRTCGCALNLLLHVIKFNDLLSLLWQINNGSSPLGRYFPNIGFALLTALSVSGRPVITQEINTNSVFKVIYWTFT